MKLVRREAWGQWQGWPSAPQVSYPLGAPLTVEPLPGDRLTFHLLLCSSKTFGQRGREGADAPPALV